MMSQDEQIFLVNPENILSTIIKLRFGALR